MEQILQADEPFIEAKVPVGQLMHVVEPVSLLNFPREQEKQREFPPREYLPAVQELQEDDSLIEYLPGEHAVQYNGLDTPVALLYVPEGQVEHNVRPVPELYVPTGQFVHVDWPAVLLYFPEGQEVQDAAPPMEYLPGEHFGTKIPFCP
jgi:hypothetical protein